MYMYIEPLSRRRSIDANGNGCTRLGSRLADRTSNERYSDRLFGTSFKIRYHYEQLCNMSTRVGTMCPSTAHLPSALMSPKISV